MEEAVSLSTEILQHCTPSRLLRPIGTLAAFRRQPVWQNSSRFDFTSSAATTCSASTGSNSQVPTPVRSWFPFGQPASIRSTSRSGLANIPPCRRIAFPTRRADRETRERSWALLNKGDRLISTLTEPSQDRAKSLGVTAMRYTVEPDGEELAKIGKLAENDKLKPHIQATFPLEQAAQALSTVEHGHTA